MNAMNFASSLAMGYVYFFCMSNSIKINFTFQALGFKKPSTWFDALRMQSGLVDYALQKIGRDNVTVMVIRFSKPGT